MILYHGTSEKQARAILKEGLIPGKGKGGDEWLKGFNAASPFHSVFGDVILSTPRPKSVFLSHSRSNAAAFAEASAEMTKDKPIVLKVNLPMGMKEKLKQDEFLPSGLRYEGAIPPVYISPAKYSGPFLSPDVGL